MGGQGCGFVVVASVDITAHCARPTGVSDDNAARSGWNHQSDISISSTTLGSEDVIDKSSKIQSGGADNCGHLGAVGNECTTSGTGMWSGACAGAGEGHSGGAGLWVCCCGF